MKNIDGKYPDKIMLPQVSSFVFKPMDFKKMMENDKGLTKYMYNYEEVNENI